MSPKAAAATVEFASKAAASLSTSTTATLAQVQNIGAALLSSVGGSLLVSIASTSSASAGQGGSGGGGSSGGASSSVTPSPTGSASQASSASADVKNDVIVEKQVSPLEKQRLAQQAKKVETIQKQIGDALLSKKVPGTNLHISMFMLLHNNTMHRFITYI